MINLAEKSSAFSQSGKDNPHRSVFRRALYSIILVAAVLIIGTVAFHYIEGYTYVDAFYFMSMLATAEGPAIIPQTVAGKLLASIMAFISIGSVIFALGYIFGPVLSRIAKLGEREVKKEEKILTKKVDKYEKRI